MMKRVGLYAGLLVLFFIGTAIYANIDGEAKRREEASALAVEKLPSGVEDAWVIYVENRLTSTIQRQGRQIQLIKPFDDAFSMKTYISWNMPYTVDCSSILGGSVTFGSGDNSILIPVFGVLASIGNDRPSPPELGVHERSVAAKRLYVVLCPIISEYMQVVTQQ